MKKIIDSNSVVKITRHKDKSGQQVSVKQLVAVAWDDLLCFGLAVYPATKALTIRESI